MTQVKAIRVGAQVYKSYSYDVGNWKSKLTLTPNCEANLFCIFSMSKHLAQRWPLFHYFSLFYLLIMRITKGPVFYKWTKLVSFDLEVKPSKPNMLFSFVSLSNRKICSFNFFAADRIQTANLWYRQQPFCQLSRQRHCPFIESFNLYLFQFGCLISVLAYFSNQFATLLCFDQIFINF